MSPITLPEASAAASNALDRAIADRQSHRGFGSGPIALTDVAAVLWAAQGYTHGDADQPMRAAPSAGATYPLETYLEVPKAGVTDLDPGLYRYDPVAHTLEPSIEGTLRPEFVTAANDQPAVDNASATIVLAAEYDRTTREYPDHGRRYVHMEAGHAAQNLHLVCVDRGLASCPVGAFDDAATASVLELPAALDPLYLLPVGASP